MYVLAQSAVPHGLSAQPVWIEVHRGQGLPGVTLVGLARGAAKEALVRVRSALQGIDVLLGSLKLTVSLLPAEVPKEGSALDLALAAALLAIAGRVPPAALLGRRFFGELSLTGEVLAVGGAVRVALLATQCGDNMLHVAPDDAAEASLVPDAKVLATDSLAALQQMLRGTFVPPASPPQRRASEPSERRRAAGAQAGGDGALDGGQLGPGLVVPCLSQVMGQPLAKQALVVAAAGGHNVLLTGPPGSGKSMLAQSLPGLLPRLTASQQLMALQIQSAAGQAGRPAGVPFQPPFRAPHHAVSEAALLGGGAVPLPGEVTLAHDGVLFLDELPQFGRKLLEALRGPLEDGSVCIARAKRRLRYPARCLLVAAMNPCPCGLWRPPDAALAAMRGHQCLCAFAALTRYRAQLSGPLLDRLDVRVFVDEVGLADFVRRPAQPNGACGVVAPGSTSAALQAQVVQARARQHARQGDVLNAWLSTASLDQATPLTGEVLAALIDAQHSHQLTLRGIARVRKVARTLADLRGAAAVASEDVAGAVALRGAW